MSPNEQFLRLYCSGKIFLIFILLFFVGFSPVCAQQNNDIQIVTGFIDLKNGDVYTLPGLMQGDMLYVYAEGTSGNLDPFVGLSDSDLNISAMIGYFRQKLRQNLAEGKDPFQTIPETANKFFLKWNDDTGQKYDSSFQYKIPKSGDYKLLILNSPLNQTFGDYKMLIGIGSPEVMTGDANSTPGANIAVLSTRGYNDNVRVQEINGSVRNDKPETIVRLNRLKANDTLYAYIKAESGNLAPVIILNDFGNKTLVTGNWGGSADNATLQYAFLDGSKNNYLRIRSGSSEYGNHTTGNYSLLLGINSPEVLNGNAKPVGKAVALAPIEVKTAIELEQITDVNQKEGRFGVLANLWMDWTDPDLAFSPESCQCNLKSYDSVDDFVEAEGDKIPQFSFGNLESLSDQNVLITVKPDGTATFSKLFTATLSAPEMDLRRYPFDTQKFSIEIDFIDPDDNYVHIDSGMSNVSARLRNAEWDLIKFFTNTSKFDLTQRNTVHSRFSFYFLAQRHIDFYLLRIFIPITLIIILTWLTFFLHRDYMKRIEIASANLLLFIAYNFTIANDLPKLGYVTLMDRILISTFFMTVFIFAFNVFLRWLDMNGKKEFAERLDGYMLWIYSLAYICGFIIAIIISTFD